MELFDCIWLAVAVAVIATAFVIIVVGLLGSTVIPAILFMAEMRVMKELIKGGYGRHIFHHRAAVNPPPPPPPFNDETLA